MAALPAVLPWELGIPMVVTRRKGCSHLQDLSQLLAAFQLQRGLADALIAGFDLLCLLLQSGLKMQAAQTDLVFRY